MIEERLQTLMADDAPPQRDPAFQLAVMARIERRRFRHALLVHTGMTILLATLLAPAVPAVQYLLAANAALAENETPVAAMFLAACYAALRFVRT